MKKSLYSLILSDEVVAQIDKLAYKSNTNRSNMVNQILADYVSYTTPEKRMSEIFSYLENIFSPDDSIQTMLTNSSSMMNLRSSLDFKYNPTVKYSVELYRTKSNEIGELKVSMRTQNAKLILYLIQFFKLFAKIESKYLPYSECYMENEKFTRKLKLHTQGEVTTAILSEVIAEYIKMFDNCLKAFFYNIDDFSSCANEIENIISSYVRGNNLTV